MKWQNLKSWGPTLQWDNRSHSQGPSYGDEGGAFIRQRRSVMLLSLVLLAIHFLNVNAADISLIGIDIQLPDSSWLYISLWIAQLYFIYRFGVFRNLLGEARFQRCRKDYRTKLVGDYGWKLLKREPQKYVAKSHHSKLMTGRKLRMIDLQPHTNDICSYTIALEPRDDKDQLTTDLAAAFKSEEFEVPKIEIWKSSIRAYISAGFFTPQASEFWLPLFLCELAIVAAYYDIFFR